MLAYMTTSEAAERWNISHRKVLALCQENKIPNVATIGNIWIIPKDTTKPTDSKIAQNENTTVAKPFVKWAGGKGQLLPTIRMFYPPNMGTAITKYCEPIIEKYIDDSTFVFINEAFCN